MAALSLAKKRLSPQEELFRDEEEGHDEGGGAAIVNLPVMQSLSNLTDEMIHAVAKALGGE